MISISGSSFDDLDIRLTDEHAEIPTERRDAITIEEMRERGQLQLESLLPEVAEVVEDRLARRMAMYPLHDDDLHAVVAYPLGLDQIYAVTMDPAWGVRRPVTLINSDWFSTPEALQCFRSQHDVERRAGLRPDLPDALGWLFDHEFRHPVIHELLRWVDGADALIAERMALALGVEQYVPGRHGTDDAKEITHQIGLYGALGASRTLAQGRNPAQMEFHVTHECYTEALTVHDSFEAHPEGPSGVALAVGVPARSLMGAGRPGVDERRRVLRERALDVQPLRRLVGGEGASRSVERLPKLPADLRDLRRLGDLPSAGGVRMLDRWEGYTLKGASEDDGDRLDEARARTKDAVVRSAELRRPSTASRHSRRTRRVALATEATAEPAANGLAVPTDDPKPGVPRPPTTAGGLGI
jgi:hypothetical protein